ncbi:unnamed protein product [Caenorhabditis sp. 36 PRJEB53466]|nr:unnamed protein product [Caenorhabditis sp. 36 PRJEB53466]
MSSPFIFEEKLPTYAIIGGAGYLGANIIKYMLPRNNCEIIIVDPSEWSSFETAQYPRHKVRHVQKSFLSEEVLDSVLPECIAVFHLASIGHRGLGMNNHIKVHDFNVGGTKLLLRKCKEHGVKRFVYASSIATVYVGNAFENKTEDEEMPQEHEYINAYSSTKAKAEAFVLAAADNDFHTSALRFRGIFGAEDIAVIGRVANLTNWGINRFVFSAEAHESRAPNTSVLNCAKAFFLADRALAENYVNGQAYFIVDTEIEGQYTCFNDLARGLGRNPPNIHVCNLAPFVPFILQFIRVYENICDFTQCEPIVSRFDFLLTLYTNTYSIAKAQKDLGYTPEMSIMPQIVQFHRSKQETTETQSITASMHDWIFIFVATIIITILFYSTV